MNHEQFGQQLCAELHIDTPSLRDAVRFAVANAMGGKDGLDGDPGERVFDRIAVDIEDFLGSRGEMLRMLLNSDGVEGWRAMVQDACRKVLARASGGNDA